MADETGGRVTPPDDTTVRRTNRRPRLGKAEVARAKSRRQYLSLLTMTPISTLFSLDASTVKVGVSNRGTQYKLERFTETVQTDPFSTTDRGIQIPEPPKGTSRFPSLLHFLRASSATVSALLDESQFGLAPGEKAALTRLNKFTTETVPLQVAVTSTRTYALVSDILARIVIWTARSQSIACHLISSDSPCCFCLYRDGRYVIAGTDSGSLLVWDVLRTESAKQDGIALILPPVITTDPQGPRNLRQPIASISVFGRAGAAVVLAVDASGIAGFWHIRNEASELSLVRAETVKISSGFLPTFSAAMFPGSVNAFLVGCGRKIFNCCRFGSATCPAFFTASAVVKSIAFSPVFPQMFAAACDNGRLGIYDVSEDQPVIEFTINLSLGDVSVAWSPTRASVLFVADLSGMRVFIFDLLVSMRVPVFIHKVGSAAQSVAAAEVNAGVVLAIAEGGLAVNVYRVADELSRPLGEAELSQFRIMFINLT
jgi:hypothetical protein